MHSGEGIAGRQGRGPNQRNLRTSAAPPVIMEAQPVHQSGYPVSNVHAYAYPMPMHPTAHGQVPLGYHVNPYQAEWQWPYPYYQMGGYPPPQGFYPGQQPWQMLHQPLQHQFQHQALQHQHFQHQLFQHQMQHQRPPHPQALPPQLFPGQMPLQTPGQHNGQQRPAQQGVPLQRPAAKTPLNNSGPAHQAGKDLSWQLSGLNIGAGPRGGRARGDVGVSNGVRSQAAPANPKPQHFQPQKIEQRKPLFALDVECVASGPGCGDRQVAQIAVVDEDERVVLNVYVKPEVPVFSYLTELTGLTEELVEGQGVSFEAAMALFKSRVPESAVLISYNIDTDLAWLKLPKKGEEVDVRDLKGAYRQNPDNKLLGRRAWGQDHLAKVLLGMKPGRHDAVSDAIKSMKLWRHLDVLLADEAKHWAALDLVDSTPKDPSFAMRHPTYDGVCMGNRKTCCCGRSADALAQATRNAEKQVKNENQQTNLPNDPEH